MTLDLKPASNYALARFKKISMFSGKECSRWQMMKMLELEREFFTSFVTEALNIWNKKFMKLFLDSTMTRIQISEEPVIRSW
jgi:transcription elongation factor GreA-like protein